MRQRSELWRQIILDFHSRYEYNNPFQDVSIQAVFTGPSGRQIRREAYWDGGDHYKISFAPAELGRWSWVIQTDDRSGLNGQSGEIECEEYTGALPVYQHGFLRVHPSEKYLMYDDGTPFFWLGDTHWEFAYGERWDESNHPDMDCMFKGMAKKRMEQGYNIYQTNLRSDTLMGGDKYYWLEGSDGKLPNIAFYQNELDRRMYYLADLGFVNALGFAWFISITDNVELQKSLARYIVARYGALPVIWTLAGEVAGYSGGEDRKLRIDGWREVAEYVESIDGYGTLQTAHYTNERPFADYYQDESWFDFTLNQAGHGDFPISPAHYREFRKKFPRHPFIEGECFYEFCSTLEENGTRLCTADMLRRVAYMSIQLGGCGYTYGAQGIWDNVWEKGQPNPMKLFNQYDITWYEAIEGAGGKQMGYMKAFYEKVRFWELHPYEEEGEELTGNPFGKKFPLITISEDANRLVLYYSDTVRKQYEIKDLSKGDYSARWFDPREGKYSEAEEIFYVDNGVWETPVKPGKGDWLLVVEQI
nr:DUF4038 domain-containing protein [uncultured Clostridium sp.]